MAINRVITASRKILKCSTYAIASYNHHHLKVMTATKPMTIELDGGTLEGGGQLLRIAVALSALTHIPVRIPNVRRNRNPPGLKAQHTAGLALTAQITRAYTEGIEKGSQCVFFDPTRGGSTIATSKDDYTNNVVGERGGIRAGVYEADPGTAGSTMLLLQVSLPCLLFPEVQEEPTLYSTLVLKGGTNALNAPQVDYAQHVLFPFLKAHVLPSTSQTQSQSQSRHSPADTLHLDIIQRGFYPYGGGLLHVRVPALPKGQTLRAVTLTERGDVVSVKGIVIVSGVIGMRVASEVRQNAIRELRTLSPAISSLPREQVDVRIETDPQGRAGSAIVLLASTSTGCVLAGSALGAKGIRAAQTGKDAARELVRQLEEGGCVDEWLQDQMIAFLALASGRSVVRTGRITLHARTAIWVAEQLTDAKFEVKENVDGTGQSLVTCEGTGLEGRL